MRGLQPKIVQLANDIDYEFQFHPAGCGDFNQGWLRTDWLRTGTSIPPRWMRGLQPLYNPHK
jgi:hypothetical protein